MIANWQKHRVFSSFPTRTVASRIAVALLCCLGLTQPAAASESDVRIVIDVSGSMKQSDPDNLRRPALTVLTGLLPDGSQAGVWTFGQYVNMLVKHGPVNGTWKEQVRLRADTVGSVALRTNIGAALEQVSWDLDSDSRRERHIVLLTDGRVDISADEAANLAETDRILKSILPGLVERGVKLHTLALSEAADVNFLKQLSLATGGYHGAVDSAGALTDFFLKALANAAPPSEVVLDEDAGFLIDDSVSEFTALLRGAASSAALLGPDGRRLTADKPGAGVRWFRDTGFDLVTVRKPAAGRWQADLGGGDSGRVSIVSNLELAVGAVPATISPGYRANVTVALKDAGTVLADEGLLSVLSVEATLQRGDLEPVPLLVSPPIAADGLYQVQLGPLEDAGEYVLQVRAVAPTFTRAKLAVVTLRDPVGLRVESMSSSAADVVVEIADANIDFSSLRLIGKVAASDGAAQLVPLGAAQAGLWRLPLSVDGEETTYSVTVDIRGNYLNGQDFSLTTSSVEVSLPEAEAQSVALAISGDVLRDDQAEAAAAAAAALAAEAEAARQAEPTAPGIEAERESDAVVEPPEPVPWGLIAGASGGTLVLAVLTLFAVGWLRRRRVSKADEAQALEDGSAAADPEEANPFDSLLQDLGDTVEKAKVSTAARQKAKADAEAAEEARRAEEAAAKEAAEDAQKQDKEVDPEEAPEAAAGAAEDTSEAVAAANDDSADESGDADELAKASGS